MTLLFIFMEMLLILIGYSNALQIILDATRASLNWNKYVGLWVSDEPCLAWYPGPTFRCLNHGEPIHYLGCHFSIDSPYEVMLSPLLLSITRKLVYWYSQHLSFVGQAVITNSVLLALS
mgnify:CR=1 FL=1